MGLGDFTHNVEALKALYKLLAGVEGGRLDSFNRERVSTPHTLFDSKQLYNNSPLFWDDQEVSGGGTSSSFLDDQAETKLSVSENTAGKRVRQTYQRFNYQPGKSLLIEMTGTLGQGVAGVTSRIGYSDGVNGVYFMNSDGVLSVARLFKTSTSPLASTEFAVPRDDWNFDKLDGNGPSGKKLDLTKEQIFHIDLQWLGVGTVAFGFVIDRLLHYVHFMHHANILDRTYIGDPNLPLRYEIENDGTGPEMQISHICTTVISEGGIEDIGCLHYHSNGATPINANTVDTIYALVGIRLRVDRPGIVVKDEFVSIDGGSSDYEWLIIFNPTIAGSPSWSNHPNSDIQVMTGDAGNPSGTTLTGGYVTQGGYVNGTNQVGSLINLKAQNAMRIGIAIDGTQDELLLGVRPRDSNADITGAITWRELS